MTLGVGDYIKFVITKLDFFFFIRGGSGAMEGKDNIHRTVRMCV